MTTASVCNHLAPRSVLHHLDPRIKLVTTGLLVLSIILTPTGAWPAYPLIWTLVAVIAVVGEISPWRLARLGSVSLVFGLAAVTLVFMIPGNTVVAIDGLIITDAGLERFVSVMLKAWLAAQSSILFILCTPFADVLDALEALYLPRPLVLIMGFMYRYLFILREEADRMMKARAARSAIGYDQYRRGKQIIWQARTVGKMVASLFLRSHERSERVYQAMQARGFRGNTVSKHIERVSWKDIRLGCIPLLILMIIELCAVLLWSH